MGCRRGVDEIVGGMAQVRTQEAAGSSEVLAEDSAEVIDCSIRIVTPRGDEISRPTKCRQRGQRETGSSRGDRAERESETDDFRGGRRRS